MPSLAKLSPVTTTFGLFSLMATVAIFTAVPAFAEQAFPVLAPQQRQAAADTQTKTDKSPDAASTGDTASAKTDGSTDNADNAAPAMSPSPDQNANASVSDAPATQSIRSYYVLPSVTSRGAQNAAQTQPAAQDIGPEPASSGAAIMGTIEKMDMPDAGSGALSGIEIHPLSAASVAPSGALVAHTHLRVLVPVDGKAVTPVSANMAIKNLSSVSPFGDPGSDASQNTPASLACIYKLAPQPTNQPDGCNPVYTSVNPAGGGGSIALVDAFHYPSAAADLNFFSRYFNLPAADFHVVYAGGPAPYITGPQPPVDSGWNMEAALDIEWSHALAPYARIYLVEAQDDSFSSLLTAVQAAQYLVNHNGGGEISMSWGATDFSGETTVDSTFSAAPSNVVQVASAGDVANVVSYPSSSPNVISVGGTTLNRIGNGIFSTETAWGDGGGGVSANESRPSFQNIGAVETVVGTQRGTPDVSMLADPSTGVAVYEDGLWNTVGGTSLSAPLVAGLLNSGASNAGSFPNQSTAVATLYTNGAGTTLSRDIIAGSCGTNSAAVGYDLCTGMGSLISYPYNTSGHGGTSTCSAAFGGNNLMSVTVSKNCDKSIYAQ